MVDVPRDRRPDHVLPLVVGTVVALAGTFAFLLFQSQQLPDGVVPVPYDAAVCGHCRMHVGEPSFAAQAQLPDGQVLNFDDPGCMFEWMDKHPEPLHAAYVHHRSEDRWLRLEASAFVRVMPTPMGFGLGAVDPGTPGSITVSAAREQVRRGADAPPPSAGTTTGHAGGDAEAVGHAHHGGHANGDAHAPQHAGHHAHHAAHGGTP